MEGELTGASPAVIDFTQATTQPNSFGFVGTETFSVATFEVTVDYANLASETFDVTAGTEVYFGSINTTAIIDSVTIEGQDSQGEPVASWSVADLTVGTAEGLNAPHAFHTSTLLGNGKVLIAGGKTEFRISACPTTVYFGASQLADLYDPSDDTFSLRDMGQKRYDHTATLLDPNGPALQGDVLLAGGSSLQFAPILGNCFGGFQNGDQTVFDGQIYDPGADTFRLTLDSFDNQGGSGPNHTATPLEDGTGRVLMAGGFGFFFVPSNFPTIFDPVTEEFREIGNFEVMTVGRQFHTATLLPDGQVLLAGGIAQQYDCPSNCFSPIGSPFTTDTAELIDPTAGVFAETYDMNVDRSGHTATALGNGLVVVTGGTDDEGGDLDSTETFNLEVSGDVRTQFKFEVKGLPAGNNVSKIENAEIHLVFHRQVGETEDTQFYVVDADVPTVLATSDFEAQTTQIPGGIMEVPDVDPVGVFQLDVTSELQNVRAEGRDVFSIQGRVDSQPTGSPLRGLSVVDTGGTCPPGLSTDCIPTLVVTPDMISPTFVITEFEADFETVGRLFDGGVEIISEDLPYQVSDPEGRLQFIPEDIAVTSTTGFNYNIEDGLIDLQQAQVSITVVAVSPGLLNFCLIDGRPVDCSQIECNDGFDNDMDGKIDTDGGAAGADPDPQCSGTSDDDESS